MRKYDTEELKLLIDEGYTCAEIGQHYGISRNTAWSILKRRGLRTKTKTRVLTTDTHRECTNCNQMKPLSEFSKVVRKRSGKERWISHCNSCNNVIYRGRQVLMKKTAVDYKGGSCQRCGYDTSLAALQFHHRDPSAKDFSVSRCLTRSKLIDIFTELDKCDLLCANCHAEEHYMDS